MNIKHKQTNIVCNQIPERYRQFAYSRMDQEKLQCEASRLSNTCFSMRSMHLSSSHFECSVSFPVLSSQDTSIISILASNRTNQQPVCSQFLRKISFPLSAPFHQAIPALLWRTCTIAKDNSVSSRLWDIFLHNFSLLLCFLCICLIVLYLLLPPGNWPLFKD